MLKDCTTLLFLIFYMPVFSTVHYIGMNGTDQADCSGGTKTNPWATINANFTDNGCVQPGDTVYVLEGVYDLGGFTLNVNFFGSQGLPVTLAADPEATGEWPVKIIGKTFFTNHWGVVEGIEFHNFYDEPVMVGGTHIVFKNNYVNGRAIDVDIENGTRTNNLYDCIKILSKGTQLINGTQTVVQVEDVQIIGNEICNCPEDAIDVTGPKDIVYRQNIIHDCWNMQVKGGTENILIEQNHIYNMRNGFMGWSMSCPNSYCGSPTIPLLPILDRFVAKNVTIQNNIIENIKGTVFAANGWKNASIFHNTIYFPQISNSSLINMSTSGFDFWDNDAISYCAANPGECQPCQFGQSSSVCVEYQKYLASDIKFKNNIVYNRPYIAFISDSIALNGFECTNNVFYNGSTNPSFVLEGNAYTLQNFTYASQNETADPNMNIQNGSFELNSSSIAINNGSAVGVLTDFNGYNRDAQPDIGAHEFGGTTNIKDINNNNVLIVYPNPTNGLTTIKMNMNSSNIATENVLTIYNASGMQIAELRTDNGIFFWNVHEVTSGFYYTRLNGSERYGNHKIIVIH